MRNIFVVASTVFSAFSPLLIAILLFAGTSQYAQAQKIAEGVTLTQITSDGKSYAVRWAPHGDKIAVLRVIAGNKTQLYIMNSDGTEEEAITEIGRPRFAQWSWNGDRLSYIYSNAALGEPQAEAHVYDLKTKKSLSVSAPYDESRMDADDGPFWSADDEYVMYRVAIGPSRDLQAFVANTVSGKVDRLLPDRTRCKDIAWSPTIPPRVTLCVNASAEGRYDIANVLYDSKDFIALSDVNGQEIRLDNPEWSPRGDWIAFTNNADMQKAERDTGRSDLWVSRPDGSKTINLTKGTSQVVEEQIYVGDLFWSWDGKYILSQGSRYDMQGKRISTYYLTDVDKGTTRIAQTSDPEGEDEITYWYSQVWSWDSTKILYVGRRSRVKDWEGSPEYDKRRWILGFYDVEKNESIDLLEFDEKQDQVQLPGDDDRDDSVPDVSWSPDNRSILFTIARVISAEEKQTRPDVYRLDLPERFISSQASRRIGPPIGSSAKWSANAPVTSGAPATSQAPPTATVVSTEGLPIAEYDGVEITTTVFPKHITIEEALASIPTKYTEYLSMNPSRNLLLFKGPGDVLDELRSDLALVDTPPTHILVDLLAVELSDEANRQLGLDWTYTEGRFAFFQPGGAAIRDLTPDAALAMAATDTFPGTGQSFYQGVGALPREFFVRLNSQIQDGEGTILANPRTVSMSNSESTIQILKTVNFFFNEGFDTSGRPVVKKSSISADTMGTITPTLLPDGRIHLDVDINVGSFTFSQDAGLPEQTSRKSKTKVTVGEGESIVIGGLRQQEANRSETKTPILGYIPILKPFFTKTENNIRNSVLTIFITPQILKENTKTPAWPTLDAEEHKVVPIMDQAASVKSKPNGEEDGMFTKFFKFLGF